MKGKISAFIICFNEEANIERALNSINWCDEIVVIDSGSRDKTLEICKKFNCKVLHRDWTGYVDQKAFGLSQCTNEWVLNIDADEEVSTELQREIKETLSKGTNFSGFKLLRVVFHLGRWWNKGGWHPEYRLRLIRRSEATWAGHNPHEHATVAGSVGTLKHELRHYTYTSIEDQIARLNRFSSTSAEQLHMRNRKFSIGKLLFNPIMRFFKFFIIRKGYREGLAGLVVAIIESHHVFLKYAKLWELETSEKESSKD